MSLEFPASPTVGDTYTVGARTWTWSGTIWEITGTVAAAGSIGTTELADSAITTAKIAAGAVAEADIADGAVTSAKIAAGAVVEADIASNAVTAGKLGTDVQLGYRNVVINGAMQVAQRGTSTASITTSGYYTADRWFFENTTLGTWTQTLENDAPTGSGFRKSLKVLCTTADASPAAADQVRINQYIEGQNVQQFAKGTASAKQFTVSFWVKSNVTGTYILDLRDHDNTRQVSASYTISTSATWEKKTITFPADTTGVLDNDNEVSLRCIWWLGAGSNFTSGTLNTVWASNVEANRAVGVTNLGAATNNYWQVTGVQLEVGAVATPFEFEDIGTTLQKCQRYYEQEKTILQQAYWASNASGVVYGGSFVFNTAKRAAPTLKTFDALNAIDRHSTFDSGAARTDGRTNNLVQSSVAGFSVRGYNISGAHGYGFYWTAESEL
jgi:hypothetical protein